jgi:hypothetical protein
MKVWYSNPQLSTERNYLQAELYNKRLNLETKLEMKEDTRRINTQNYLLLIK